MPEFISLIHIRYWADSYILIPVDYVTLFSIFDCFHQYSKCNLDMFIAIVLGLSVLHRMD